MIESSNAAPGEVKFTVARNTILAELDACAAVADSSSAIQPFRCVRIDATTTLQLRATRGIESIARRGTVADVQRKGATLVNVADLISRVKQFSEGPIDFATKDGRLVVRRGKDRFQLSTLDADLMPVVAIEAARGPSVAVAPFLSALAQIASIAGTEGPSATPVCVNVCLQTPKDRPGRLLLLATNGHGAARVGLPISGALAPRNASGGASLPDALTLVTSDAAAKMARALAKVTGDVQIEMVGTAFHVWSDNVTYEALAPNVGAFPSVERIIPARGGKCFRTSRQAILDAARSVRSVKPKRDNMVLTPDGDGMILRVVDDDGNPNERSVVTDGAIAATGIQGGYALECLGFHAAHEEIIVWQADPLAPLVFTPVVESEDVVFVMPQRI